MYLSKSRNTTLYKSIALVMTCLILINDIAWADPSLSAKPSQNATLAAESRFKPFFEKHGLEFQNLNTVISTAVKLRNLFRAGEVRESHIVTLNDELRKKLRDDSIEIHTAIGAGSLMSGKRYSTAIFDFKKENKKVGVLFLRDPIDSANLTKEDLRELKKFGVKTDEDIDYLLKMPGIDTDADINSINNPQLEGIWFVSPNKAIPIKHDTEELPGSLAHPEKMSASLKTPQVEAAHEKPAKPTVITKLPIKRLAAFTKNGLKIAGVQIKAGKFQENTARMAEIIRQLADAGPDRPDLIVFPEDMDEDASLLSSLYIEEVRGKIIKALVDSTGIAIAFSGSRMRINNKMFVSVISPDEKEPAVFTKYKEDEENRRVRIKGRDIAFLICIECGGVLKTRSDERHQYLKNADAVVVIADTTPSSARNWTEGISSYLDEKPVIFVNLARDDFAGQDSSLFVSSASPIAGIPSEKEEIAVVDIGEIGNVPQKDTLPLEEVEIAERMPPALKRLREGGLSAFDIYTDMPALDIMLTDELRGVSDNSEHGKKKYFIQIFESIGGTFRREVTEKIQLLSDEITSTLKNMTLQRGDVYKYVERLGDILKDLKTERIEITQILRDYEIFCNSDVSKKETAIFNSILNDFDEVIRKLQICLNEIGDVPQRNTLNYADSSAAGAQMSASTTAATPSAAVSPKDAPDIAENDNLYKTPEEIDEIAKTKDTKAAKKWLSLRSSGYDVSKSKDPALSWKNRFLIPVPQVALMGLILTPIDIFAYLFTVKFIPVKYAASYLLPVNPTLVFLCPLIAVAVVAVFSFVFNELVQNRPAFASLFWPKDFRAALDGSSYAGEVTEKLRKLGINDNWDNPAYKKSYLVSKSGTMEVAPSTAYIALAQKVVRNFLGEETNDGIKGANNMLATLLFGKKSAKRFRNEHGNSVEALYKGDLDRDGIIYLLETIRDDYVNPLSRKAISYLNDTIASIPEGSKISGQVDVRIWQRDPWHDLSDNETLNACVWLGGAIEEAAMEYIRNKSLTMLDFYSADKHLGRVTLCASKYTAGQKEEPVLVVECMGGTDSLDRSTIKLAIEDYARACGFPSVIYNRHAVNNMPDKFIKYLDKQDLVAVTLPVSFVDTSRRTYLELFVKTFPVKHLIAAWTAPAGLIDGYCVQTVPDGPAPVTSGIKAYRWAELKKPGLISAIFALILSAMGIAVIHRSSDINIYRPFLEGRGEYIMQQRVLKELQNAGTKESVSFMADEYKNVSDFLTKSEIIKSVIEYSRRSQDMSFLPFLLRVMKDNPRGSHMISNELVRIKNGSPLWWSKAEYLAMKYLELYEEAPQVEYLSPIERLLRNNDNAFSKPFLWKLYLTLVEGSHNGLPFPIREDSIWPNFKMTIESRLKALPRTVEDVAVLSDKYVKLSGTKDPDNANSIKNLMIEWKGSPLPTGFVLQVIDDEWTAYTNTFAGDFIRDLSKKDSRLLSACENDEVDTIIRKFIILKDRPITGHKYLAAPERVIADILRSSSGKVSIGLLEELSRYEDFSTSTAAEREIKARAEKAPAMLEGSSATKTGGAALTGSSAGLLFFYPWNIPTLSTLSQPTAIAALVIIGLVFAGSVEVIRRWIVGRHRRNMAKIFDQAQDSYARVLTGLKTMAEVVSQMPKATKSLSRRGIGLLDTYANADASFRRTSRKLRFMSHERALRHLTRESLMLRGQEAVFRKFQEDILHVVSAQAGAGIISPPIPLKRHYRASFTVLRHNLPHELWPIMEDVLKNNVQLKMRDGDGLWHIVPVTFANGGQMIFSCRYLERARELRLAIRQSGSAPKVFEYNIEHVLPIKPSWGINIWLNSFTSKLNRSRGNWSGMVFMSGSYGGVNYGITQLVIGVAVVFTGAVLANLWLARRDDPKSPWLSLLGHAVEMTINEIMGIYPKEALVTINSSEENWTRDESGDDDEGGANLQSNHPRNAAGEPEDRRYGWMKGSEASVDELKELFSVYYSEDGTPRFNISKNSTKVLAYHLATNIARAVKFGILKEGGFNLEKLIRDGFVYDNQRSRHAFAFLLNNGILQDELLVIAPAVKSSLEQLVEKDEVSKNTDLLLRSLYAQKKCSFKVDELRDQVIVGMRYGNNLTQVTLPELVESHLAVRHPSDVDGLSVYKLTKLGIKFRNKVGRIRDKNLAALKENKDRRYEWMEGPEASLEELEKLLRYQFHANGTTKLPYKWQHPQTQAYHLAANIMRAIKLGILTEDNLNWAKLAEKGFTDKTSRQLGGYHFLLNKGILHGTPLIIAPIVKTSLKRLVKDDPDLKQIDTLLRSLCADNQKEKFTLKDLEGLKNIGGLGHTEDALKETIEKLVSYRLAVKRYEQSPKTRPFYALTPLGIEFRNALGRAFVGSPGDVPQRDTLAAEAASNSSDVSNKPVTLHSDREIIDRVSIAIRSLKHGSSRVVNIADNLTAIITDCYVLGIAAKDKNRHLELAFMSFEKQLRDIIHNKIDPLSDEAGEASRNGTLTANKAREYIGEFEGLLADLKTRRDKMRKMRDELAAFHEGSLSSKEKKIFKDIFASFDEAIEKMESRIEIANAKTASHSPQNIGDIIEDIRQNAKNIIVVNNLRGLAGVNANRLTLTSALLNIIYNGMEVAREKNGSDAKVTVTLAEENGFIKIDVTDNGNGIPVKLLKTDPLTGRLLLFELNVSQSKNGTGLGTTEAWYAVTDMGGTIEVKSETGKGATFTIRLPKSEDTTPAAPRRALEDAFGDAPQRDTLSASQASYHSLINDRQRLAGVDAFLTDFDGVDRVAAIGNDLHTPIPAEVPALREQFSGLDILNCIITGDQTDRFLEKVGGIAALAKQGPCYFLTRAGAMAEVAYRDGRRKFFERENYAPASLGGANVVIKIEKIAIAMTRKALAEAGLSEDIEKNVAKFASPQGVTIHVADDANVQKLRYRITELVRNEINVMIKKKEVPETTTVTVAFGGVDIAPVSKRSSAIQMIKMFGLKKVAIIGDSLGTEQNPGGDRGMLTLRQKDLEAAGIDWEVDLIQLYAGNEEVDIPEYIYVIPESEKTIAPPIGIYEAVIKAKAGTRDAATIPPVDSLSKKQITLPGGILPLINRIVEDLESSSRNYEKTKEAAAKTGDTVTPDRLDRALVSLPAFTEKTIAALEKSGGHQANAATILGISKPSVSLRIKAIRKAAAKAGDTVTPDRLDKALKKVKTVPSAARTVSASDPEQFQDPNLRYAEVSEALKTGLKLDGSITAGSLREAIEKYKSFPVAERNRITREIARRAIEIDTEERAGAKFGDDGRLANIEICGIGVEYPADLGLKWDTLPDGSLYLAGTTFVAGGGGVNSAKVAANNGKVFGLVSFVGTGPISEAWRGSFASPNIIPYFIAANASDSKVNISNMSVSGDIPRIKPGRAEDIPAENISEFQRTVESVLSRSPKLKWLIFTAVGASSLTDKTPELYRSIIEMAHERGVQIFANFSLSSTSDEIRAILADPLASRKTPSDIIGINEEELCVISKQMDLIEDTRPISQDSLTPDTIKYYASKLVQTYNLQGALITRGSQGLLFVTRDSNAKIGVIEEKSIPIEVVDTTGAGDSANMGLLLALIDGKSAEEAARQANIFGAATTTLPGTQVATPDVIKAVTALVEEQDIALIQRMNSGDTTLNYIINPILTAQAEISPYAAAQSEAEKIHAENLKILNSMPDISNAADKTILCHIITDSIVPPGQQNMLKVALVQNMEKEMRKGVNYRDGFACLSGANASNPTEYLMDLQILMANKRKAYTDMGYTKVLFDVACPDPKLVSAILKSNLGVKALAFEPSEGADFNFAQVEVIMLALRTLYTKDINRLKAVFKMFSKKELTPGELDITDIDKFIETVSFILPTAKVEDYERVSLNNFISASIKQAA